MQQTAPTKILALLLITMMALTPTAMAANHTFSWGSDVGDEYTYALQRKTLDLNYAMVLPYWMGFVLGISEGQEFTATVMELEPIPEEIGASENLPLAHVTLAKNNGTDTLEIDSTAFMILVGDWSFHEERLNVTVLPEISLIDTEDEWGTKEESSFTIDGAVYDYIFEWRYDKQTGALTYVSYRVSTFTGNYIDIIIAQWEEGMPTVLPAEIPIGFVLTIVLGSVVSIVVALLIFKWIRRPKSLAAELGK